MKKILCILLVLSLLSCAFCGCDSKETESESSLSENAGESDAKVVADEDVTPNDVSDFAYTESEGEITISGYKGSSTEVNIPSEINGKPVTAIGEYAFDGYEAPDENSSDGQAYRTNNINSILSVHIPSSVKTLKKGAFTNCYSLTSVTFAEGTETIGEGAFACCDSITAIALPDSVKNIEGYAFFECYKIESVTFGKNVESIGEYAFYDNNNLSSLKLPDSVKEAGTGAFAGCDLLTEVKLSSSLTEIPESCFMNSAVTEITLPEGITSVGEYAFCRCQELKKITLPDSVTSVGEKAFFICGSLSEIKVPDSVTAIGSKAFGFTADTTQANENGELDEFLLEGFTLKGSAGSAAEKYASENGLSFK